MQTMHAGKSNSSTNTLVLFLLLEQLMFRIPHGICNLKILNLNLYVMLMKKY